MNIEEDAIDPKQIIGKACHVEVESAAGATRYFHGLCTEIRLRGWRGDFLAYELVLRPWTWLLTRETRCEIFHDLKVDQIISKILNDRGFSDHELKLSKSYEKIPYCVQYQETTFAFISRLMEKFGLFFYFQASDSKHLMVVVDDQNSLPDISEYGELRFQPFSRTGIFSDRLFGWETENRLRTAIVDVDDYNYEKPNTALEKTGNAKDTPDHAYNKQKQYRYPAGHLEPGEGQLLADVLVDAERADAERKFAFGHAPLMHAGGVFTLADHPVDEENDRHFSVAARHLVRLQRFRTGDLGDEDDVEEDRYEGEYEVAEVAKAYKAPPRTPLPRVHGAQTALVIKDKTAPSDEEIDVDDQGRILVRFHWNTQQDDQCSCRVRVAQIWAGAQWGGVWIPRVGMEVVVEFLDGDPDRPLVTGTVYNGSNKSPVTFPADKTKSTIKSNSSKGGSGANEFTFDDKKDNELVTLVAEKNYEQTVKNNAKIRIGYDKADAGDMTFELKNDLSETVEGKHDYTLTGNLTETIKTGNHALTIQSGNQSTKIDAGKGEVQAMQSYEIKVGSSSIKLEPAKITISSPQILIDASMKLDAKGGTIATVNGGASLTLSGGMVKIN